MESSNHLANPLCSWGWTRHWGSDHNALAFEDRLLTLSYALLFLPKIQLNSGLRRLWGWELSLGNELPYDIVSMAERIFALWL